MALEYQLHEELAQFGSSEYQDPSFLPQRPDRWYNGSIMGSARGEPDLFGNNGRLRSLHKRITSQETPGSQPRTQSFRTIADLLSGFFPITILDRLVEEILTLENVRLSHSFEEATGLILAAVEMYLRKNNRMILKEKIIAEINRELGLELNSKKVIAARRSLARNGFWKDCLYDINMATYDILRNLILDISTTCRVPVHDDLESFRRRLFKQSLKFINHLSESRRRPQALEVYAHVIVSISAEEILGEPVRTSKDLGDPQFDARVYRAKRQFFEMVRSRLKDIRQKPLVIPGVSFSQFFDKINTISPDSLPDEAVQRAWGEMLRLETVQAASKSSSFEKLVKPYRDRWMAVVSSRLPDDYDSSSFENLPPELFNYSDTFCVTDDCGPGPPWKISRLINDSKMPMVNFLSKG